MTPILREIMQLFQQADAERKIVSKNDPSQTLREAMEESDCECATCGSMKRALGMLSIETKEQDAQVKGILLDFLQDLPEQQSMPLLLGILVEVKQGLHPDAPPEMKKDTARLIEAVQAELGDLTKDATSTKDTNINMAPSTNRNTVQPPVNEGLRAVTALLGSLTDANVFKNTKVVREGEAIIVPTGMSCRQAIEALEQQAAEDETNYAVNIEIDAYPFEGARAFHAALAEKFGWVGKVSWPKGFFGSMLPPTTVGIEVDVGKTEQIIWGRVQIPALEEGHLETGITVKDDRFFFCIEGEVKQKHRKLVEELADLTRTHVKEQSMYRGKALRITFPDPKDKVNFSPLNSPKFMDVSKTKPEELIFSADLQEEVQTALFNPVEKTALCRRLGISLKRGTLLAGRYGVGKSMAASVMAKKCVENGWTFFYVEKTDELPRALRFAQGYSPAVVFVEDVDKVLKGERDASLDKILNTIDGIDNKNSEVMLVFTTNDLKVINKAALRAKRLDVVIEIMPPDADAVRRLIKQYTRGHMAKDEKLDKVGEMLAGQIPATIEEVCSRAQLTAVGRMKNDDKLLLKESDLVVAASSMLKQLDLVKTDTPKTYGTSIEKASDMLGGHLQELGNLLARTNKGETEDKPSNGTKKAQPRASAS